jgi:DNA-binding SARP family transcriptional activator
MAEYNVLGPLEVLNGERVCTPTPPKVRSVLALLLLEANHDVLVDSIIQELWGDEALKSAVTTVQTYIYHLRKIFAQEELETQTRKILISRARGYVLRVAEGQLDSEVFHSLVREGRKHIGSGRPDLGAKALREALALWRGPALADVTLGRALAAHAVHLEELRIRALELRIQADMELGLHRELVGELRFHVAINPLNEWFHRQLIWTLCHCGRRSEALHAYQHLRRTLNEELGLDPSPDLQRLHQEVLSVGHPDDMARHFNTDSRLLAAS